MIFCEKNKKVCLKNIIPGWLIILFILLLACPAKTGESAHLKNEQKVPSEFELKATYLYNFLKFIKWPKDTCELHDGRSHTIAVLGESPFNQVLQSMQAKLQNYDKDLQLRFYGSYQEDLVFECCCLLFITDSEQNNFPKIMQQIAKKPILTVSDDDVFMDNGGMITLVMQNNKIRWIINREPVEESGLQLSAKLFDIAVKVINE